MAKFKDRTVKDKWFRYCELFLALGEKQKAWQLFHLVTCYAWDDCIIPVLDEDYTLDVQILFNTIRHEIDGDSDHLDEMENGKSMED